MKMALKKKVKGFIRHLGYDVVKYKSPVNTQLYYELYGEEEVKKGVFIMWVQESSIILAGRTLIILPNGIITTKKNIDIIFDLLSLNFLPIEDESARIIYSSHTIEHINDEATQNLFNEAYRILKSGGCFRVTCPNTDLDYRAWRDNDRHFFTFAYKDDNQTAGKITLTKPFKEATIGELFLWHIAASTSHLHPDGSHKQFTDYELKKLFSEFSYEDALDYITSHCPLDIQKKYPGNHINWFNPKKIKKMLNKAGFNNIHRSGYAQSFCPPLRNTYYFDNTKPHFSLYMEAFKK